LQATADALATVETSLGLFTLRAKISLGYGRFVAQVVRGEDKQARFWPSGSALRHACEAGRTATHGHIAIHRSCSPFFKSAHRIRARMRTSAKQQLPKIKKAQITPFLSPVLAAHLQQGTGAFVNEHRHITVLFAGFGHAPKPATLAQAMTHVQTRGGYVARLDADDKGVRMLALFGAPTMYEDNAVRAVQCALALVQQIRKDMRVSTRVGIASGFLFCGDVGAASRREYTVMGDAVNLAARLMQIASAGQVQACGETRAQERAQKRLQFEWQQTSELALKGKVAPVAVFVPRALATRSEPTSTQPAQLFLGRARELGLLWCALDEATAGTGSMIWVEADAGMGKSRLAAQLVAEAHTRNLTVIATACQPHGQAPFAVWRRVLLGLMELDAELRASDLLGAAGAWVAQHTPALREKMALLAPVLGLPNLDEPWTQSLDPAQRWAMLAEVFVAMMRTSTPAKARLVVMDDAHWMDERSRELLHLLQPHWPKLPTMLLLLSRPEAKWSEVAERNAMQKITLRELDATDALALAQHTWRTLTPSKPANNHQLPALVQRGQGNPFFIEQLVRFAAERGDALDINALPDTLRSLLLRRIDQLPAGAQTALKLASVVGVSFHVDWVSACWPGQRPPTQQALDEAMQSLLALDLVRHEADERGASHTFRHATLREAAYESLSFAMRASLHERIGLHVESRYPDQADYFVQLLAHHFGHSKNAAKQRLYFRKAGDAARATYANELAVLHYTRLLPLLSGMDCAPVLLQLGEVQAHLGAWTQAEDRFRQALQQPDSPQTQAQVQQALGRLLARSQSYAESAKWLRQAQEGFARLGDAASLCNTLTHLAFAQLELGELDAAHATATTQWQIAQTTNDLVGMAEAWQTLGQIGTQRGEWAEAQRNLGQARELVVRIKDPRRLMLIDNDIATLAWRMGDDRAAFEHFVDALDAAQRIGLRSWVGVLLGNLGVLFWEWGVYGRADACFAHALRIALDVGDQTSVLTCLGNAALLLRDKNEQDLALRVLDRSIGLGEQLQMPYYLCDHACSAAEMAFDMGNVSQAKQLWVTAQHNAEIADDDEVRFRLRLLQWRMDAALQPKPAVANLRRWLAETQDDEQRALLLDELWQMTQRKADANHAAAAYRALHRQRPRERYRRRLLALGVGDVVVPEWVPALAARVLGDEVDEDGKLQLDFRHALLKIVVSVS
jgi:predicted ATPase